MYPPSQIRQPLRTAPNKTKNPPRTIKIILQTHQHPVYKINQTLKTTPQQFHPNLIKIQETSQQSLLFNLPRKQPHRT